MQYISTNRNLLQQKSPCLKIIRLTLSPYYPFSVIIDLQVQCVNQKYSFFFYYSC